MFALALALCSMPAVLKAGPLTTASDHRIEAPGHGSRLLRLVAVFGEDDREKLPKSLAHLRKKIGLLFDNSDNSVCTAFCVSKNVVATAAHCVFRSNRAVRPNFTSLWFSVGPPGRKRFSRLAGASAGTALNYVMAGTTHVRVRPPLDASSDWALARLSKPICEDGGLALKTLAPKTLSRTVASGRTFQVAYHKDFRQWQLAYGRSCGAIEPLTRQRTSALQAADLKDFVRPDGLFLHRCDTGGASSGSPLLFEQAGMAYVIGVNIGTYIKSRVVRENGRIVAYDRSKVIANTAVASLVFKDMLARFLRADILSSRRDIRALQERLRLRRLYDGPIDGRFGMKTRAALIAFEASRSMPLTGVPTRAHLVRLTGGRKIRVTTALETLLIEDGQHRPRPGPRPR